MPCCPLLTIGPNNLRIISHTLCSRIVSAFVYFGAKVDAGFPFNIHKDHNTANWVGPLSMILAQNTTDNEGVLDHYVARYVESPSTKYLQMEPNCSLFGPDDFENYMGETAVKNTVKMQTTTTKGDPYQEYLKTCDNGSVKPILPLYDFTFVEDATGKEAIQVKLDYKILTFPKKTGEHVILSVLYCITQMSCPLDATLSRFYSRFDLAFSQISCTNSIQPSRKVSTNERPIFISPVHIVMGTIRNGATALIFITILNKNQICNSCMVASRVYPVFLQPPRLQRRRILLPCYTIRRMWGMRQSAGLLYFWD